MTTDGIQNVYLFDIGCEYIKKAHLSGSINKRTTKHTESQHTYKMDSACHSNFNLDLEKNDCPMPQSPKQALRLPWHNASQETLQQPATPSREKDEDHRSSSSSSSTLPCKPQPHHHPIEDIYPLHHGFHLFLSATILLLLLILTLILTFRFTFYTPPPTHRAPAAENAHTHHLTKFQRAFINKLPWNFCFSIIWLFVIYVVQFVWDKDNMMRSWRYRLGALMPLLFNACLGTLFFTVVGWLLLVGGARPIVVAGEGERASGF